MELLIITRNLEINALIFGPALEYISSFLFSNNYTFGVMTNPWNWLLTPVQQRERTWEDL